MAAIMFGTPYDPDLLYRKPVISAAPAEPAKTDLIKSGVDAVKKHAPFFIIGAVVIGALLWKFKGKK